jgi:hypothetical protein
MKHSIFAFEICARFEPGGRLHTALRDLVRGHPANATHQQKWLFYKTVSEEIRSSMALVEKGCWDYFDEDKRALRDYDQWVAGMVTEEGARREPSGSDPYRGDPRWMTFTMAFLLVNESACDVAIRELCDIPEANLWKRETFWRILAGIKLLNFASIKSDVAYLIPRDDGWGLTQHDLAQPKFAYLRALA